MLNCRNCGVTLGIGLCACGLALGSGEAFEFKRPSASACEVPYFFRDFGPPPGCDNETLPHNRMGWLTSVASTGSVTATGIGINPPLVAAAFRDLEDAANALDQMVEVSSWVHNSWVPNAPPHFSRLMGAPAPSVRIPPSPDDPTKS
jgi:hypothetical protein